VPIDETSVGSSGHGGNGFHSWDSSVCSWNFRHASPGALLHFHRQYGHRVGTYVTPSEASRGFFVAGPNAVQCSRLRPF